MSELGKYKSIKHRSVSGCTGFAIQKFIKFLFGTEPIKTKLIDKTIVFYLSNSIFDSEKSSAIAKEFEKSFGVSLKPIRDYE